MEAKLRAGSHQLYDSGLPDLNRLGRKSFEWDLNDWQWDGDLFVASPLNAVPSNCRKEQLFLGASKERQSSNSSTCSDEADFGIVGKGKGALEKRRRTVVNDDEQVGEAGALALNLGGNARPIMEADLDKWEGTRKRTKLQGGSSNRPICQVEGCGVDLSDSKDYHRRHKVCEMHAKAITALVNNVMQRFCQQCSRFHLLQEFDEGKRSCRRRLAGHNRRRRKSHPDGPINGNPLVDDRASSYLVISLLRILSNLHSGSSDQSKDQDLLSHLLRNLATLSGSFDARNLSGLLQASQGPLKLTTSSEAANGLVSNGIPAQESSRPLVAASKMTCITGNQYPPGPADHSMCTTVAAVDFPSKRNITEASPATLERVRLRDFDLNSTYSDTQSAEGSEKSADPAGMGTGSPASCLLQDSHQSSPPQMSLNSESSSAQSLSSSNVDAQSRTDRIIFKLFHKDPNDLPLVLRAQILDWLSHSPTDIESYIRPGCIILTIYLRLPESDWEKLCRDLSSSLNRLLYNSGNDFWRTGWVYARIQHQITFIYNGQVVLNTPMLLESPNYCKILCVTPVAAAISATVNFTVKGFNLSGSTARLLCAFDGMSIVKERTVSLVERDMEHEGLQSVSFFCSLPSATGRGFIEVEDHGLSSGFFPFIVAEDDVCSEIRTLEDRINLAIDDEKSQERTDAIVIRDQALNFLNEMGWLLRRSHLRSMSEVSSLPNVFSLERFRWLMTFAMDREWCAVVKKLLDLLFHGTIDLAGRSPNELAMSEGFLHSAVRKNCKSVVELLLRYTPYSDSKETGKVNILFRPDLVGPSNITPLHIAAAMSGAEAVLDALTDDPGLLGIKAWRIARDSTGCTPEDYAQSRGQESYLHLVQKKIDNQSHKSHVILNISGTLSAIDTTHKHSDGPKSTKFTSFAIDKSRRTPGQQSYCNLCFQQVAHRSPVSPSLLYRPALLSMVGIAAVCVCVGILLKGPPQVVFVFPPFRWEKLGYGSI